LPAEFLAEESTHAGAHVEIDVATFEQSPEEPNAERGQQETVNASVRTTTWSPPAPTYTVSGLFPDSFEVQVFSTTSGMKLVGAIELVSPGNKDRHEQRRGFVVKCASYLYQGVSLVIVDIVTNRRANLHNELLQLIEVDEKFDLPEEANLYAVAYRPVLRGEEPQIDLWTATFDLGQPLPVMPLRLTGDLFVPVDLESTYQEACRRRRLM
jgi:hypothetical protein